MPRARLVAKVACLTCALALSPAASGAAPVDAKQGKRAATTSR